MDEILSCLIEEVNRCRGLAKIPGIEAFKDEYLHKAELLERAAEILKQVAAICPHGRLIDADAIRADIDEKRPGRSYEDVWTLTVIDAAPTIIPANREIDHE